MQNNQETKQLQWYQSWTVILLTTLCFWPLAIPLVVSRLAIDRSAGFLAGGILKWTGAALTGISGILVLALLAKTELGAAILLLIPCAGGVWMYRYGNRITATAEMQKKLIQLIVNQEHRSIDTLAQLLDRSNEITGVFNEVKDMMNEGKLPGFQLDPNARMLTKLAPAMPLEVAAGVSPVAFTCRNCGANNKVLPVHGVAECEYCGRPNGIDYSF